MGTSARKHTIPLAGETPTRAAIASGFASVNDIIPVPNATARAQLLADLAAPTDGSPAYTPSAARPLHVRRADAAPGAELEVTTDGSTWRPVGMTGGIKSAATDANGVISVAHGLGYAPTMMGATVLGTAHGTGSDLIARYATPMVWLFASDAIQFRFVRRDTNEWFILQPIAFSWWAR